MNTAPSSAHLHIAPTHTFPLRHHLDEVYANYLRTCLFIFQGRMTEADLSSICEIEGHQYLYNFASLPTKSICRRCHHKWLADYSGDLTGGTIWRNELIKAWGG